MTVIGDLWKEISRPSDETETPYIFALVAIGHAMLGAALSGVFGIGTAAARMALSVGYWLIKERADLRRGGAMRDGLIDTGFVLLGALYAGPWWWPVLIFASVLLGLILKEKKGNG